VLHVIDQNVVSDLQYVTGRDENDTRAHVQQQAQRQLNEWIEAVQIGEGEAVIGNAFEQIMRHVHTHKVDLLVMGARGWTHEGGGAGVLAARCVRKAPTRVMLIGGERSQAFKRIVACVDFSDVSRRVLEHAVAVAKMDGASLDVIYAYYPPWQFFNYEIPMTEEADPDYQRQFRASLQMRLQELADEAGASGVEVRCELIESFSAGAGIVKYAQQREADLVVLGTRGRTGLNVFLMGTTAERVVRDVSCSVLAIKPADFHYEVS